MSGLLLAGCSSLASLDPGGAPIAASFSDAPRANSGGASGALSLQPIASGKNWEVYERGSDEAGEAAAAATDPALASLSVSLSFVDTDIREFARIFFSEILKRPYVIDPAVSGAVTLRSGGKVDGNAALAMARQALASSGAGIAVSNGVYRVSPQDGAGEGGLRTILLKHIGAEAARDALGPLLAGRAEIVSANGSRLVLRADAETADLAASLISVVDVDQFKSASFGLFPLTKGDAEPVKSELEQLYAGSGSTGVTLVAIERMNAILVIAPRSAQLDFARTWIARLDQGDTHERQINTYRVQHRQAADLATLLREIFVTAGVASSAGREEGEAVVAADDTIRVTADSGSNTLVVWANAGEYELVERALRRLDTPLKQVHVEATIAEVRLTADLSHGVRWFFESGPFAAGLTDAGNGAVGPEFPGFNFQVKVPEARLVISALESHTDVKIVSSPNLTVVDRQQATIQVGDQVPIVTKSVAEVSGGSAVVANDVTFRDTGVILKVTPQIQQSGDVLLEITQEVSRVLPTTSSQINSPTISQRKITSTVLVADGTSIVLGGLMSSSEEEGGSGLPGAKPNLLDAIFGSGKESAARTELLIIIRPVIIDDRGDLRDVVRELADKMPGVMQVSVR